MLRCTVAGKYAQSGRDNYKNWRKKILRKYPRFALHTKMRWRRAAKQGGIRPKNGTLAQLRTNPKKKNGPPGKGAAISAVVTGSGGES
ncbi:hypothetical protein COO20_11320 [Thalassospira marina]|uniref:Uncharacterized protein n=1 Tax=Thalassospira marina TaxID=2048283 RepID=A0A2N3KUC0_9PROT|nr:hypothetical protein COO20_11320 [Thalassospira marina]